MALHGDGYLHAPAFEGDNIVCRVCGNTDWHKVRLKGVFCGKCNCRVEVEADFEGDIKNVEFDTSTCWSDDESSA